MFKFLKKLGRDTKGATAVEYGLILALIFLAMVGSLQAFGSNSVAMWNDIATRISNATGSN